MAYAIGIDIGGTNIKSVAVTTEGEVVGRTSRETLDDGTGEWIFRAREALDDLERRVGARADRVGVASPGIPSRDRRSIASRGGRLERLQGLDWTTFLGRSSCVPVVNDAQAALLGEAWCGAAAGREDVLLLTLGTGVGGAILSRGRLLRGHLGRAGELGHVTIEFDGPPDPMGTPGSLESAIGDHSVAARSRGRWASTRALVAAYRAGDEAAAEVWLLSVRKLSRAIAGFINVVDPEAVVIGGGIAAAGDDLFEPLARYLAEVEWRPFGEAVPILRAALGDYAGAIGAARNALDECAPDAVARP